MGQGFSIQEIPDLSGKNAYVTGGNTGIGLITCKELARKNANVFLACRTLSKGHDAAKVIKDETGKDVTVVELDLASLESIQKAGDEFIARDIPLHIFIANAGIMATPYGLTKDGIEQQFGTNVVGHFHLTNLLLPAIIKAAPSRVVLLSSLAHKFPYKEGVRFDKINDEKSYSVWAAYGQSKLGNILHAKALAKRLADKQVFVNAAHPGYVATELQRNIKDSHGSVADFFAGLGHKLIAISPENGARTTLFAATSPQIEQDDIRGRYFVPYGKEEIPTAHARDEEMSEKLWTLCENLIKEKLGSKTTATASA